ncbi:MAG: hypothetical protein ACLP7I_14125, partial [Limisphaerales bacterium]
MRDQPTSELACQRQRALAPATCSAGRPKTRASDKSVRDLPVNVKNKDGQIIAEQKTCGIVFS